VSLLGRRWTIREEDGGLAATSEDGTPAWGVRAHLDHLWLAPTQPRAPLPYATEWGEPGWHHRRMDRIEGRFGAGLLVDNQLDAGHFAFVHAATFGNPAAALIPPATVTRDGTRVTSVMRIPITAANDHRAAGAPAALQQYRTMHYQYEAPLHLRLRLDYEDMGGSTVILFSVTPLAAGRARMDVDLLFSHPDGFTEEQLGARVAFEDRVVGEDVALQRRFEDLRLPLDPTEELHTRADRLSVQCRQVLRDLLAAEAP
jgi:vanillate O-demethylase monooxygenase subunit